MDKMPELIAKVFTTDFLLRMKTRYVTLETLFKGNNYHVLVRYS